MDSVDLAVLNSRFDGVIRSMVNTLVRTGRSGVLSSARDFSCCIVSAEDELVAMAESVPIHVVGANLMTRSLKELHPEFQRGDAYLHNSPYHGNTHAADHTILVPVVDEAGTHHFTVLSKAHMADTGNAIPTTYSAAAKDVYEEGALIFPCVRVQQEYRDCDDIIRMCKLRIRVPDQWWGDYLGLLGSARIGERLILGLAGEVGWETLHAYTREWLDYSEDRMISAIKKLPEASITIRSAHDPFPGVPEGIHFKTDVRVDNQSGFIDVDLRDNPDSQPCGLNLSQATSFSAATVGVFNSVGREVPANAGSFRRIRIHLRENCVVGIPRHPNSCSVATTNLSDRVANSVQKAIAELAEDAGMAEAGLQMPPSLAVISGRDPRAGNEAFVNQLILSAITGGPGGPRSDGWLTMLNVASAGVPYRDSVEIDELRHPIRIWRQYILPDTEGPGKHRGAPGALVEYGPVGCELDVIYASDGTTYPARGVRGGGAGARARQFKRTETGEVLELDSYGHVVLADGETIVSESCGGGGFGPPFERDSAAVHGDVREGWITPERARAVYGVVIEGAEVDEASTLRRRESLREASAQAGEEAAEKEW